MKKGLVVIVLLFAVAFAPLASYAQITRPLQQGSTGSDVTYLQRILNALQKPVTAPGQETGFFGSLTASAVKALQCEQGIVCAGTAASTGFGVVGAKTKALLDSLIARVNPNALLGAAGAAGPSGLASEFTFDEGTGSTAKDSVTGSSASVSGAQWTAGKNGNGLAFTADGNAVNISSSARVNSTARTVSFWVNPSSFRYYSMVYEDASHEYTAFNGAGQLRVNWVNASGAEEAWNFDVGAAAGAWQLITIVYNTEGNGASINVYRNGALVSSHALANGYTPSPVAVIGARSPISGGGYLGGSMDEFRIYGRALSASDVQSLYASYSIIATPTQPTTGPLSPTTTTYSISNIVVTPATDSVTISWNTPTATLGSAEFGTTVRMGSLNNVLGSSVSHTAVFNYKLQPDTLYYYRINVRDAAGNILFSTPQATVKTLAVGATTPTPVTTPTVPVSNVYPASNILVTPASTAAAVSWTTPTAGLASMEFGLTNRLGSLYNIAGTVASHFAAVTNLQANSTYYYRLNSRDANGKVLLSTPVSTFKTLASGTTSNTPTTPTTPPVTTPTTPTTPTVPTIPTTGPTFTGTYYVDFDGGSDASSGTSAASAWKHAPGDRNATGLAASAKVGAGTTILFKGGVAYRGSIAVPASGTSASPVVYKGDGWGSAKAIIEGAEPITNFTRCTSQADCAGNPNWAYIYHAAITPASYLSSETDIRLNITQGSQIIIPAQFPMSTSRYYQVSENYYSVPVSKVTSTSISDARLATLGGSSLVGSYVYIWANPNDIYFQKITGYNASTNTITFPSASLYTDRDTKYAIANVANGAVFNQAGEYYYNSGTRMLYVWPLAGVNPVGTNAITIAARTSGFDLNGQSNVTVTGFFIEKQSGDQYGEGAGIFKGASSPTSGITITNNEMALMQTNGYAAVSLGNVSNVNISNNYIHDILGDMRGIQIVGGSGATIANNHLNNIARTGIYFGGVKSSLITGNLMEASYSSHGNGISVYQGSSDIEVSNNKVVDSNIAFTMEASANLNIHNNIFDGSKRTGNVMADWSSMTGTNKIVNNTIVGSNNGFALHLASDANAHYTVANNIIDGGGERTSTSVYSKNVYVGLLWNQTAYYGWSLLNGETIASLTSVFNKPGTSDYSVKSAYGSIGAGNI